MTESKKEFRKRVRALPRTVDDGALCRYVLESKWFRQANAIMAYAAIPPEANLSPVLEEILTTGKTLILPRCEKDGIMTARRIDDLRQLISGVYGIPEPKPDAPVVSAAEIDLILVPGLAFDRTGGRLGKGKGYYDRFLSGFHGNTMGICGQLMPEVPMEQHDITMDAIATDHGIIICRMEGEA
jgi:5-formyltetrahydrofolate cyclo-ligase